MRLIVRQCEGLTSPLLSHHHGFLQLRLAVDLTPRFARSFTTSGSLATWSWNSSRHQTPTATWPGKNGIRARSERSELDKHESPADDAHGSRENEKQAALKREFNSMMETGQPDQIMTALLNPENEQLVASMPQSVFVEAFHLLSPSYFVEPYKAIYHPLHPHVVYVKKYKSLQLIFDAFARNLFAIVRVRRSAGYTLGLAEYTHLLDCARSLGDALMADYVWHSMEQDQVTPDVQCYNYYMEAKVWNHAYTGLEKFRVRMTPYAYRQRRYGDMGWEGYGTGPRSVRKEIRKLFNEMTEAGNDGNEASIVNLLMASSRVGHKAGMKNILRTIWNVDLDALKAGISDPTTHYDPSSPFYPTGHLFHAVAHAFGTNNDIAGALQIIEHFSNTYDIEVPDATWRELLERSFVLSRPRCGQDVKRNYKGRVSFQFLKNLYETMTQEPINVSPTVEMHHKMAKTAWNESELENYLHHMRGAYKVLDETRQKKRAARQMVESYLQHPRFGGSQIDPRILRSRGFADAVHAYDILRVGVMQQLLIMERLARLLVMRGNWTPGRPFWRCMLLPQALEEWKDFLPGTFNYRIETGSVEFRGETGWSSHRLSTSKRIQVRRPSLNDKFTPDKNSTELDDCFIWDRWRDRIFHRDLNSPILKRLFEPLRIDHDVQSSIPLPLDDQDMAYDTPMPTQSGISIDMEDNFFKSNAPPTRDEEDEASQRQKEDDLAYTFGSVYL
ncbi:mitochondrial ATPase expression-domain-containing protein [Aspergillus cavernicola]|uniref:Mitochondrial ATPase expression-domain-containing protein n=1 Tax=Aspergillus cavernicola TaxID=176166 RepID=A0ABR4IT36_9EURO